MDPCLPLAGWTTLTVPLTARVAPRGVVAAWRSPSAARWAGAAGTNASGTDVSRSYGTFRTRVTSEEAAASGEPAARWVADVAAACVSSARAAASLRHGVPRGRLGQA